MKSTAKKNILNNNRGMTLIEIMIVIAIIGGLMATIGSTVFSTGAKAKVGQTKIQMRELGKAIELYALDCGSVPKTDKGLNALLDGSDDCENWGPDAYIKKNNLKDPWNNEFIYEKNGSGYTIISLGADGREGGSGNDKDLSSDDI